LNLPVMLYIKIKGFNVRIPGSSCASFSTTPVSKLRVPPALQRHPHFMDFEGEIQRNMRWRDTDIVISVPVKSGTTWVANIVHQLRSKGDPKVRDIYEQVPWLELWEYPTQPAEELYRRWDALPTWYPRAFKTHAGPPILPYNKSLKYIVVLRDPRDAVASLLPFMQAHNDEYMTEWGLTKFNSVEEIWMMTRKASGFFFFINEWWKLKNEKNVLMLHFADMSKDHHKAVDQIAKFCKFDGLTSTQLNQVYEYTSFKWMKEHSEKFALQHVLPMPPMKPEAMIRKGTSNEGKELPKAILEEFNEELSKQLTPDQRKWVLSGGPLPK